MDSPITKRLHIAGLTPTITLDDISKRLSTFGSVESVDGLGATDGVGLPRKFAFVTLHTTVGKLARCMNVLSGSTWKGAKLKLGEAKPDFRERLAAERAEQTAMEPPRKRQRVDGIYASDMSLVTPETAKKKAGWKVTEMGRVLSKSRMRPEHPLPPKLEDQSKLASAKRRAARAGKTDEKKQRKRKKDPVSRARRVTIDVTKWDSTQLKGMFLESQVLPGSRRLAMPLVEEEVSETSDSSDEEMEEDVEEEEESTVEEHVVVPQLNQPPALQAVVAPPSEPPLEATDIALEKLKSLNLLSSIFPDEDDWIGQESVGSDVDEEELLKFNRPSKSGNDNDFELVPLQKDDVNLPGGISVEEQEPEESEEEFDKTTAEEVATKPTPKARSVPNLKDLFAPREEEAAFSLLGHLDLDLDLDEELQFVVEPAPETYASATKHDYTHPSRSATVAPMPAPTTHPASVYIDPKEPLFFPSNDWKHKGAFDVVQEKGWLWRDPAVAFYRTATEDEIRAEWEEKKGDLTKDWKRRAREAMKMSRRRGKGRPGPDADAES